MFKLELNKTYEFTVRQSDKVALIAKLTAETTEGFYFEDEIKGEKFALRREEITSFTKL